MASLSHCSYCWMTDLRAGAGTALLTMGWKLGVGDHRATRWEEPGSPPHQPRLLKLRLLWERGENQPFHSLQVAFQSTWQPGAVEGASPWA